MKSETHWQRLATSAVIDDLFTQQSQLTTKVLPLLTGDDRAAADAAIDQWRDGRGAAMVRHENLLVEVRTNPKPDLAMLAVALRQLRSLTAT
jgi:glutamate dehydrogenase